MCIFYCSLTGRTSENGFGKPNWLNSTEVEYKACTQGVGVVDMTSLGLFEIEVSQTSLNHSPTSPCGHLHNMDICLLRTVRLVPERPKFI